MKKCLVAIACLTTLGSSLALAQDSTRNAPPAAKAAPVRSDTPDLDNGE